MALRFVKRGHPPIRRRLTTDLHDCQVGHCGNASLLEHVTDLGFPVVVRFYVQLLHQDVLPVIGIDFAVCDLTDDLLGLSL